MTLDDTAQNDTMLDDNQADLRLTEDTSMAKKTNGKAHSPEPLEAVKDDEIRTEAAVDEQPAVAAETDPLRAPPSQDTAFGQAIWLMMNTPQFKHTFLADLEWMILPPILLNQYRVFYAEGRVVGFAAWAYVSDEVKRRLEGPNPRLKPAEWKSGENVVLTELFSPFGGQEEMLKELKNASLNFKDRRCEFIDKTTDSNRNLPL